MYIVETEFLFGLRTDDRWHKQVSGIIELHKDRRIGPLFSCASALLEVGVVMQTHGHPAGQIEDALFLMRQKMTEASIVEVGLNSDDIIRLYELLRQYDIEYFDAMQAAVALGRNATIVTNDKTFSRIGIKTISFQELMEEAER